MKLPYRNRIIHKLTIRTGFCLLIYIVGNSSLYSQATGDESLKVHEKLFSEELFIRTDRELYAAGEKVWIKIYKMNGLTQTPANISKVVYIDFLDLENNPVNQLKIEMDGYSGSGDLVLPDTLRSGNYILRAYTNWMENFSKDLFAYKSISVINPFDKVSDLKVPSSVGNPDSVIFYPEGGHLQAGIESKLGFKTMDKNGDPVLMRGVLTDDNNDTLYYVRTDKNGYGFISVRPSDQERLYLLCSNKGQSSKFSLPEVYKEGILITTRLKSENSGAIAKLNFSADYISDARNLFLEINSSGLSGFRKVIRVPHEPEINIPGDDLPDGISHVMVLDETGKILTDRWIVKGNNTRVNYKIDTDKNEFGQREKIKIVISATDMAGNPVVSDFSISVAKEVTAYRARMPYNNYRQMAGLSPVAEACNITDINDYLIFYKTHETENENNGNRSGNIPAYLPELDGHLISGTIRDRKSGEPLKNEMITLSFVGKAALCLFAKTDSSGNFNFVTKEHGTREIVIQPLVYQNECYVDLKNAPSLSYRDYDHGLLSLDTNRLDEINNLIISMQINNIYQPFYQNAIKPDEGQAKQNFYGKPDNSIIMSNYIELTSVKEIIAELIPGVTTTKSNRKVNFRVTRPYQTVPYENGPLVLVDGIPIYDLEKVISISSKDVEKVDVMVNRYYIAGSVLDGILHFITKKGNLSAIEFDKSIFRMQYDLPKTKDEFYSPDYSVDSLKHSHLPDFRNTLYWNPDLHTDRNGKASVEFYSSDEAARYIIRVEGMTQDGRLGATTVPLIVMPK